MIQSAAGEAERARARQPHGATRTWPLLRRFTAWLPTSRAGSAPAGDGEQAFAAHLTWPAILHRAVGLSALCLLVLVTLGALGLPGTAPMVGGLLSALDWDSTADLAPHTVRAEVALAAPIGPNEMARSWLAPLERIARSQPGVREVAAEASVGRVLVRVALAPGADTESAAEALDLAMTPLRLTLPLGGRVQVQADEASAPVVRRYFVDPTWRHDDVEALAHRLSLAPGVRTVEIEEPQRDELTILLGAGSEPFADEIRGAVRGFLTPPTVAGAGLAVRFERANGSGSVLPSAADPRRQAGDPDGAAEGSDGRAHGQPAHRAPDRTLPSSTLSPDARAVDTPAMLARRVAALAIPTPAGAVRLDALAEIRVQSAAVAKRTRIDRQDGTLLTVRRDRDRAPWIVAAALSSPPASARSGRTPVVLEDEATRWRGLALRNALLAVVLLLALTVIASRAERQRWTVAAASAAAWLGLTGVGTTLGFVLVGIPVTPDTLATAGLGLASALPFCLDRHRGARSRTAFLLFVLASVGGAVYLLGGRFDDRLRLPALAALIAAGAATGAAIRVPGSVSERTRPAPRSPSDRLARRARAAFRDPAAVWLGVLAAAVGIFLLFADAARPVAGNGAEAPSDLGVRLDLPLSTTPTEARDRALAIEAAVRRVEGVEHIEITLERERIFARLRLRSDWRAPEARLRLAAALRRKLPFGAVETRPGAESDAVTGLFDTLPGALSASRPRSPWTAESYDLRLVAADGEALQTAYDTLRDRFVAMRIKSSHLHPTWGAQTQRVVLAPLPVAFGAPRAARLAAALAGRSTAEPAFTGLGTLGMRLAWPGRVDEDAPPPQRAALLERPIPDGTAATNGASPNALVAGDLTQATDELLTDRLASRAGRFVLPVAFDVPGSNERVRRAVRGRVDAELAGLALDGAILERPVLDRYAVDELDLRLAATLAALGGVWLLATALWSGKTARTTRFWKRLPLLVAVPLVGAGALALALALDGAPADEHQALAAALALAPALAFATGSIVSGARGATGPSLYRTVLESIPSGQAWLVAAAGLAAVTLAPPAELASWALVLRHGAAVLGAAGGLALLAIPAAAASTSDVRNRRRSARERALRRWSTTPPLELEARNLVKRYGGFLALDRVSFTLRPGITGLLGPNGAGKTTLLRLLVGLLEPSRGSVRFGGETVTRDVLDAYRGRLGFLPQDFNAYPGFTAEDFLRHWARTRALGDSTDEIGRLLDAVGLGVHAARRVRDFSGGMRRRLGIGVALLGAPSVLIVDEPTTGLDLPSRQQLREILLRAAGERIVLLSTHIASDVEAVANRLLVLRGGKLVFDGSAAELQARARGRVHEVVLADRDLLDFARRHQITRRVRQLDGVRVRAVAPPEASLGGTTVEPNLEEAYLAAMQAER